jgi:hypothetical protein
LLVKIIAKNQKELRFLVPALGVTKKESRVLTGTRLSMIFWAKLYPSLILGVARTLSTNPINGRGILLPDRN